LAVKIVRQPNKIALIGVPTSAGAHGLGLERAPAALRAAGLVERLQEIGYEVSDAGDCPQQLHQPDDEHPRARNVGPVLAAVNALKPLVEQATKSGALPVILGGDCTICLGTVAGVRRYFKTASLLWFDRDADMNIPATSPSGCLHGMVVAHMTGRGAPELVRFWGEPPLVREPEIALFGLDRFDEPEQKLLERTPIRRYTAADVQQKGPGDVAATALERIHAASNQFILHFDADVISSEDFPAADVPAAGGLRLEEVRHALEVMACEKNLAAIEITEYNPEHDPEGSGAKQLVDLFASVLAKRLAVLTAPPPEEPKPEEEAKPAEAAAGAETAAGQEGAEQKEPEKEPEQKEPEQKEPEPTPSGPPESAAADAASASATEVPAAQEEPPSESPAEPASPTEEQASDEAREQPGEKT